LVVVVVGVIEDVVEIGAENETGGFIETGEGESSG
jgi:hypothetical protein